MSQQQLTPLQRRQLKGVHPDLVKVVECFAQLYGQPFMVLEGLRTLARQKKLLADGATTTLNSRHLTGHAVDICPIGPDGKASWAWPHYYPLAAAMKQAAKLTGVSIEWGGDWRKFKDGPHWQLPWKSYPATRGTGFLNLTPEEEHEAFQYAPTDYETDTGAATKSVATAGAGGLVGYGLVADPAADLVNVLTGQQGELTSGDVVRVGLAAVIVGLSLWYAYKKARPSNGAAPS